MRHDNLLGNTMTTLYNITTAEEMDIYTMLMAKELLAEETAALDKLWVIFKDRTEVTERKFKPALIRLFTGQERSVLSRMRGKKPPDTSKADKRVYWKLDTEGEHEWLGVAPGDRWVIDKVVSEEAEAAAVTFVDDIFKIAAWQVPFRTVARPFVTEAFKDAGQAAFVEIGLEGSFNVTNPIAREILRTRVFKFAKEVNETTQARLRTALAQGFDLGEGIPKLSQRVADVFDIAKGSRTDTIARTEIVGASNQGTHQGFIDSEIVETEVWIDSRDARVRTSPHNHRIDGEEVKLGERFSNGLLHPHDPNGAAGNVINCRCTTGAGKLKEAA